MKALLHDAPDAPLRMADMPVPEPGPGQVLVRVGACGLGLTLAWNRKDRLVATKAEPKTPRVIGHEAAGEVVALGSGATRFAEGDTVAAYYYLSCGACRWCDRAREDLCERLTGYVGTQVDGALAEYMVLPEHNLLPVPAGVSHLDAAVTTDAIATPLHILTARVDLRPAETVVVVGGGGGVGVHVVQLAAGLGGHVVAVDVDDAKLALAEEAGAAEVINARTDRVAEEVRRRTGGADVVVELVGTAESLGESFESLAVGGRLAFVGSYDPTAELSINPRRLTAGELVLTGSRYCTRREVAEALELVAQGHVRPVVTRTTGLAGADDLLRAVERNEVAGRAAAVIDEGA